MCNINLVYCRKGNDHRTHELMNVMSWESWGANSDGEGYIAIREDGSVSTAKSMDKMMYHEDASCIVSHQRLATHGQKVADNAHPYETENYILMHNGVLTGNCPDKTKSDSWHFVQELQNTKMSFKKAFHRVLKNWYGSASMMIYDKRNKKLFYTKNSSASFHIIVSEDWIIGSTIKSNVDYAKTFLNLKEEILTPKDDIFIDIMGGFLHAGNHKGIPTWSSASYGRAFDYTPTAVTYSDDDWDYNGGVWTKKQPKLLEAESPKTKQEKIYAEFYNY